MTDKVKRKSPHYTADFVTALPLADCIKRLERDTLFVPRRGLGAQLAPIRQEVILLPNRTFTVERYFPGALYPIRFEGNLDDDDASHGTWVHGGITQDAANQVLIEGLIVFAVFFLMTVLFFLRLKTGAFVFTLPVFLMTLTLFSVRWRALRYATMDLTRWLRGKLYVLPEQVK